MITRQTIQVSSSQNFAGVTALLASIGETEKTIIIKAEISVAQNVVIPENISLQFVDGGVFNVSEGVTLTINGQFANDPLWRIFTGAGNVVFAADAVQHIRPQWFGDDANGGRNGANIAAACASASGGKVVLSGGTYTVTEAGLDFLNVPLEINPGCHIIIPDGLTVSNLRVLGSPLHQIVDCSVNNTPAINCEAMRPEMFGAIVAGADSSQLIQKAVNCAAVSGGIPVVIRHGTYTINQTVKLGPGTTFCGSGVTDALNSLSPVLGTRFRGTASPLFLLTSAANASPLWPQVSGGDQNGYVMEHFSMYSQAHTSATGIQIGEPTTAKVREIVIRNFTSRGYQHAVDVQNGYAFTIQNFSLRDIARAAGGVCIKMAGEVTSGQISNGAIYEYETGLILTGVMAGFEVSNIDFDACAYCIKTTGYIYNSSLVRNIATEGTTISDLVFDHSSGSIVGIDGFATVVGTSSESRIVVKGTSSVVLRGLALNSVLLAPGKHMVDNQGSGIVYFESDFNPAWVVRLSGTGSLRTPLGSYYPTRYQTAPIGSLSTQKKSHLVTLGDGTVSNNRSIKLVIRPGHSMISVSSLTFGLSQVDIRSFFVYAIGEELFSGFANVTASPYGTVTQIDNFTFKIAYEDPTFSNAKLLITTPGDAQVGRFDLFV